MRAQLAVGFVAATFALFACSSGGFEPTPLADSDTPSTPATASSAEQTYESGDAGAVSEPTTPASAQAAGGSADLNLGTIADGPLTNADSTAVAAWFDGFLRTRDRYYVGNASEDELQAYLSDRALLFESQEKQQAYLQLLADDSILATQQFASFSNLTEVVADRGRLRFKDCTEEQRLSTLGFVTYRWITHEVVVAQDGADWIIAEINVVHDGEPWSEPYGCVPKSFESRALLAASRLIEENQALQQDPQQFSEESFTSIEIDEVRQAFSVSLAQQRDEGLARVSPEEVRYKVRGLDVPASLDGFVVVVDVCHFLPEGAQYIDSVGELQIDEAVPSGFSFNLRVSTFLEAVEETIEGTDLVRFVELTDDNCW